jgi:site-specific DNA-methyltransferase (adenine-specific)
MIEILQGDNLPILNKINQKYDLILMDPPYSVGKDFGNNSDKQSEKDYLSELNTRLDSLTTKANDKSNLICFASHLFVHKIRFQLENLGWKYQRQLIWHYKNGMSRQINSPVTEYEPILWMSKNENYTYNGDDVRVPYKSERVKNPVYKKNKLGEKIAWTPNPLGAKRGDVWEYPALCGKLYENERTEHPTQKPISLITDLIKAFMLKQNGYYTGNIIDPYLGSGTTAVCCKMLNNLGHQIKFTGIEMEEKWATTTKKRLEEYSNNNIIF